MPSTWKNKDGLFIKYGTSEAQVDLGGTYPEASNGGLTVTEIKLGYGDFASSAAVPGSGTGIQLPKGARIEEVEVVTETAVTSGGAATVDVGLIKFDRSTELDYNGLVAALPKASVDTAGKALHLNYGSTYAGALIGTTLSAAGIITCNYTTAALTAGKVIVRIYWYTPQTIG